jgi:hypothetical protein
MPTKLDIDEQLLKRALEVSGEQTMTAVVTKALEDSIAHHSQRRMLDLIGSLDWDTDCDFKAERSRPQITNPAP